MVELKHLFACFVLYRLSNLIFNQTWFVPDEYWQSQEVAHRLAFDYGYLTWEWRVGIRSYAYPLFLAFFYKLLQLIGLDHTFLFSLISPVVHAILTSIGDVLFYLYVSRTHGKSIARTASLLRCLSWFSVYTSTRSLSNSLEELFTIVVVFCLTSKRSSFLFHVFAFVAFVVRSTAAINLIPIYVYTFFITTRRRDQRLRFVAQFVLAGILVVSLNTLLDSYFHGSFLLAPWNFLLQNVLINVGVHYGTHPWHWYLTQGFPTLMFAHLVPFALGLAFTKRHLVRFELIVILFNILVYSLLAHKEFRFLTQIMPFAIVVCSHGVEKFASFKKKFLILLGLANLVLVIFVGIVHQRGAISVMHHLRGLDLNETNEAILFLTPCHSTPYYSYLHRNVTMRFLTCEPDHLRSDHAVRLLDEADQFYSDPASWLRDNANYVARTTRLVLFRSLYQDLFNRSRSFELIQQNFSHCDEFYYSPVRISSRVDNYLLLCTRHDLVDNIADLKSIEL